LSGPRQDPGREAGFTLPAALFVLVVVAMAGAAMVSITGVARTTAVSAVQTARSFHAARSGLEWGIHSAVGGGCWVGTTSLALDEGGLRGHGVDVTCTSSQHTEASTTLTAYTIVSVATYGSFGEADYTRRRLRARITD